MTKICHMTSAHKSNDTRIFGKECVSLARNDYDVYLVAQGNSYESEGVHIVGVGETLGGRLSRILKTTRMVYGEAIKLDADIYHFHDPELLLYAMKLKRKGKKVIFDSHEKYSEQLQSKPYLPKYITKIIARIYEKYEKYILKRIDAVIFPCTMDGNNPFLGLCKRAYIISNAAKLSEFYDKYEEGISKLPNSVCYVGGLTYERGITYDILAASKAKANLYLAGKYSSTKYQEEVEQMNEFQSVKHLGQLGRNEVTNLLQQCQIGIATLLDIGQYHKIDTFGIKVFEYMSMGLPVILSRTSYSEEILKKYKFGINVNPTDSTDIAKAIEYILNNREEADKMGNEGRKAVKEIFNWRIEEKKLIDLYEELSY